MSDFAMSK